ncbi:MAG: hypothetical protein LUE98_18615 [Tannerellaceae bacterium]|nr:hypothetical protein [Tannerellaceae bacterium]MCD8179301.1 hypothetical protein [Tannerellaceae bacterium]
MEYQEPFENKNISIVSVSNWILTLLVLFIPIANIIMLFIWAFNSSTPLSKSNFAKAALIVWVVLLLVTVLFWGSISRYMAVYAPVV